MTVLLKKAVEKMKDLSEKEQDILASFLLKHMEDKTRMTSMDSLPAEETDPWMLEEAHSEFESDHTEDIGLS